MPRVIKNDMGEPISNQTGKDHTDVVWVRVDKVVNLILQNCRFLESKRSKELTELIMSNFSISERQAQRYIKEAKKVLRESTRKDLENNLNRALLDREFMYQHAKGKFDKGEFKNANIDLMLKIAKDRDELLGLYTQNHKVSGSIAISNIDFTKLPQEVLNKILSSKSEDELQLILSGINNVQR